MRNFSQAFVDAFNHSMIYEVGGFWNPNEPDVIDGKIETAAQRKKVGYVNISVDRGGLTKYGIAQNANPTVDVRNLDLNGAMSVYYTQYWLKGKSDKLSFPLSTIHYDGCVNHGIARASKFLQTAVGALPDGIIGNMTLAAVASYPQREVIIKISELRTNFYKSIVNNNPSQRIFLKGWLRRIDEVTEYCLALV